MMKLQLSVPSKTFLMGEYLALTGGPALLLNTSPRFKLIATARKKQPFSLGNDKNDPATKFLKKYEDFYRNFSLEFHDPYHGLGGFGASSAEFCLLAALKNYCLQTELNLMELIDEYKLLAWRGKGFAPSGADIASQFCGGITYFNKNENIIKKMVWPFSHLAFGLIQTTNKVNTHQHIEELAKINIDGLEGIVRCGSEGLENADVSKFCDAINQYAVALQNNGLVCDNTIKFLKLIHTNKNILATKGCGALGADVILIVFYKKFKREILQWARTHTLKVVLIDDHAREGCIINSLNDQKKLMQVITVDENDYQQGVEDKIIAHQKGLLHRAFSVFIFRKKNQEIELLMQQRANEKYHSGGLWSNTCCSHPVPGEDILANAQQRLQQEMGITTPLYEVGSFRYHAALNNGLIEHEYDHVFVGAYKQAHLQPNPKEIAACQWLKLTTLQEDLQRNPKRYTPWLQQALELILSRNLLSTIL